MLAAAWDMADVLMCMLGMWVDLIIIVLISPIFCVLVHPTTLNTSIF